MKLTNFRALLAVAIFLTILLLSARADQQVLAPGGFCRVTPRPELGIVGRSLVVCRWTGNDETGDGVAEIVESIFLLDRKGEIDCSRSQVNILDITRPRQQLIRWIPACES